MLGWPTLNVIIVCHTFRLLFFCGLITFPVAQHVKDHHPNQPPPGTVQIDSAREMYQTAIGAHPEQSGLESF